MADKDILETNNTSIMELQSGTNTQQTNNETNLDTKSQEITEEKQSINGTDGVNLHYHELQRDSKYSIDKPVAIIPNQESANNNSVIIQLADSNNKIIKYFEYKHQVQMQLDYGFRSIYEMYRFNKRPLIYVVLSIASVYIPSLIFPDGDHGKVLFYIYLSFAIINILIIIYCLCTALVAMIKGNDDTQSQIYQQNTRHNNSSPNITFNPTDDPEDDNESDMALYVYDECSDDDMRMPNTNKSPSMIRGDSDYSVAKSVRRISISEKEKRNIMTRFFIKFCEQFNMLFDIRTVNSRIQSKIAPPFSGFLLVFCVLCCHILLAAVTDEFELGIYKLCEEDKDHDVVNGQCLGRKASILNCNSMSAVTILLAVALFQEISAKAQERKLKRRAEIRTHCESNGVIKKIEKNINNSVVRRVLNQLTMKAMFKSILWQTVVCGALVLYHAISSGYYKLTEKDAAIWFSLFGKFNTIVNGVILLNSAQRFVTQYRYILVVMRQFSKPIYCKCIDDIIAWWQYRRYYREYEIKTFANIFHPMVSWLLILTIICVLYIALAWIIWSDSMPITSDEHIIILIVAYFCFVVLFLCELAVRTHLEQRERNCGILDRELIHCKRNFSATIDVSLIIDIRKEIWNNSKPIVLVGIPITRGSIAALRTYFAGALATLIADWYFSQNK